MRATSSSLSTTACASTVDGPRSPQSSSSSIGVRPWRARTSATSEVFSDAFLAGSVFLGAALSWAPYRRVARDLSTSPLVFSAVAALVAWYLTLGPLPRAAGQRIESMVDDTTLPSYTVDPPWWQAWHHFVFIKDGDVKQVWIDGTIFLDATGDSPMNSDIGTLGVLGICFASAEPLSPAEIRTRVDLSAGSLSQGLRFLTGLGALIEVSVPGERAARYAPDVVEAYIEITPLDGVKYEIDKRTGYLRVDRPQGSSALPPTLYGFVPRTYCGPRIAALTPAITAADFNPATLLNTLSVVQARAGSRWPAWAAQQPDDAALRRVRRCGDSHAAGRGPGDPLHRRPGGPDRHLPVDLQTFYYSVAN